MILSLQHYLPQLSRLLVRHVLSQHQNLSAKLVLYHDPSAQLSYMELSQKFYEAMKACTYLKSTPIAQKLHAQLIYTSLDSSIFLQNHLLHLYSNCNLINDACWIFNSIENHNSGRMSEAEKLFREMPERDSVSWTAMMLGYFHNKQAENTVNMFSLMVRNGNYADDPFSSTCAMKACSNLGYTKLALQLHGLSGKVNYAERVFLRIPNPSLFCWNRMIYGYSKLYGMPERDCVSWNIMISIFSQHGSGVQSLNMFVEMWNQGIKSNSMTYATILAISSQVIRMELTLDAFIGSGLVDMYAKCGCLEFAKWVFDGLKEQNAVSWTSLISGFAQFWLEEEGLLLFNQMREASVALDEFTFTTIPGVCSAQKDASIGEQLHGSTIKSGVDSRECCCYNMGNIEKAWNYFDKMPERNIIAWNTRLGTYTQHGFREEGLKLYTVMRRQGVKPDWIIFATSISAFANSVVTMYSRCGRIEEAHKIFDFIHGKDLISWNAIMAGYAQMSNGQGRKVIEIFENMLKTKCLPDHISYVSVLSGCSHSGLVIEGKHYFYSMTEDFGISPTSEHFACMVDLLGRAGPLEEAKNLIDGMPFKPNVAIKGLCSNLLDLNEDDSGNCGKLDGLADVRKLMKEKGIRKNLGSSWIEVENRVHVFTVDDTIHPQIKDIYRMLEVIIKKIEDIGSYTNAITSLHSRLSRNKLIVSVEHLI
ncbi:hypothetical protein I3843_13G115000 [Carya illinoinensis]|uniref:Pentatricopeptide repeat-containing protein n=1 Tax=Carya illinoinensis TaxID=32201 RepID=A0A922AP04_CARIL|nr:hypothetical protein I3842_13G130100 [Carya illinoinensis]KAG7950487.1 hypothetical protein I3843_13G115000 [Carya illinoinensis]